MLYARRWMYLIALLALGVALWLGTAWLAQAAPLAATLTVRPTTAPAGSLFRVYAADFPAGASVQARVTRPDGAQASAATYTTDASGRVAFAWQTRTGDLTGAYTVQAQSGAVTATSRFTVPTPTAPLLNVFPFSGSPAHTFSLVGAGFGAGQAVELELDRPDGITLTLPSAASPSGGLEANVPGAGLPLGAYTVTARVGGAVQARTQFRVGPLPDFCRDLLANGGFEARPDFLGWDRSGDPFVAAEGAFSGQRVAVLAGYNNAHDVVSQGVTLPADTQYALLSYWRARVPDVNPGADQMRVLLNRPDGTVLNTVETVNAASAPDVWERRTLSLSLAGQAARLAFDATNDAQNPTSFGVDETALVACGKLPRPDVGPQDPTARPVPLSSTVSTGQIVHVDVWVENITQLYSADVVLTFDPAFLRPRTTQVRPGPFLADGGAMVTRNQVNGAAGTAQLVVTRLSPMPAVSGSGVLFSLDFDALAAGTTTLGISRAQAAAPGAVAIPVMLATAVVTIQAPRATVIAHIEGQGRADWSGFSLRVSGPVSTTVTTNSSGDVVVGDLPPGNYSVTARRQGWLCSALQMSLVAGQTLTLPPVRLLAGDVNGSDSVDIFDLVRVAYTYDSPSSVDPAADLNASGFIDIGDLVLVGTNYGATCPQPWGAPGPLTGAKAGAAGTTKRAPQVSLVPTKPTADGLTPVEVWADDLSEVGGVDLTLRVDATRAALVERAPFQLSAALKDAYVVRNTVQPDGARLAATVVGSSPSLSGRVHLATLLVKGDMAGLSVAQVRWADVHGHLVGSVIPSVKPGATTDKGGTTPAPAVRDEAPGPAWRRPARLTR